MATAQKKSSASKPASANGSNPIGSGAQALAEAIAHEEAIVQEAAEIRGDGGSLSAELFMRLRPLLRRPIPRGFIEHVGEVTGKPYESTGVKSVQVQMDRLDNVLGPDGWGYEATYSQEGKLCHVRAWVGSKNAPLFERDSYGGVKQGSSLGNVYKGSFTNAAKLAFARLGPAWEVYVGAADFDPDTDQSAAEAQAATNGEQAAPRTLTEEECGKVQAAVDAAGLTAALPSKLRAFGVDELSKLTVDQAFKLREWIDAQTAGEESQ
jgi:hypothetical protein